jgi:cellulose synthase/poly-beta-1,6-N-acetylglucosamine synthase-like glycosyltransferase
MKSRFWKKLSILSSSTCKCYIYYIFYIIFILPQNLHDYFSTQINFVTVRTRGVIIQENKESNDAFVGQGKDLYEDC